MTAREDYPTLAAFADARASGHDSHLIRKRCEAAEALNEIDRLRGFYGAVKKLANVVPSAWVYEDGQ